MSSSHIDTARRPTPSFRTVHLNNGIVMPTVGMGLYQVGPTDMTSIVHTALRSGYRLFDTASMYDTGGNERQLGQALHTGGVNRSELFITSKLWNDEQGHQGARDALGRSLERLGLDYLDLYLIHWPAPRQDTYVQTWETLLELQQEGLIKAPGVANFAPDHLNRLLAATGVAPAVNQIEVHPQFPQNHQIAHHERLGIITQAWSPLARGGAVLTNPAILRIAGSHNRSAGQVILRWHLQRGIAVVPKTISLQRVPQNIDLFTFTLSDADMHTLNQLDTGNRTGPDPHHFPR